MCEGAVRLSDSVNSPADLSLHFLHMFVVSVEHRPRNALVLVHPLSGNRSGKIYNETVAAIFRQANIETDVVGKGQDFTHFIPVDKHLYTNSIPGGRGFNPHRGR